MTKPIKKSNAPNWEKYAINGSEDANQITLFGWAAEPLNRERYPDLKWMFHIPNGGLRNKREAAKLKAMGVKPGVSDIFLPVRRGRFSGLFIELKALPKNGRMGGATRPEQKVFQAAMQANGFGAAVCVGWQAARNMIIQYLEWKN